MPERATPVEETTRSEKSAEVIRAQSESAGMANRLTEGRAAAASKGPNGWESEPTMSLGRKRRQKSAQAVLPLRNEGEALGTGRSGEDLTAAKGKGRSGTDHLMEEVVGRDNAKAALKRVRKNKGSPGIDGMTVEERPAYLKRRWE